MAEKFLLINLEEENTKKLAEALANTTARKILNYLSSVEDASETEIAERLKIPLTTTHYNLQNLKKTGLVEAPAFTWSQKGRAIDRYTIAKKFIIIQPKGTGINKEKIKNILGVGIISGIGAVLATYLARNYFPTSTELPIMMAKTAGTLAAETAPITSTSIGWPLYLTLFCIATLAAMFFYSIFNWDKR